MKINTKIRYGLRTMIVISLNDKGTGVFQKDISQQQGISTKYLDHIIASLKTANLIHNAGGKKSGYVLSRSAETINLYDIVKAFESEIFALDCTGDLSTCKKSNCCAAQEVWCNFNKSVKDHLSTISLKQVADRQVEMNEKKSKNGMYYI